MLRAQEWCEENKVSYGVLTGFKSDNSLRIKSTSSLFNYYIDSSDYGVVECVHQIFLHGVV
jgi:D-sedoheptulose 7-phosphate isomerase